MILDFMSKKPVVISYLRFSRPEQMRGDSIRRQTEASEAWARDRGLALDTSLRDEGVSAFRGANATQGALSRFLEHVKAGRVPKGSILLVESLDRLSRNELLEALELFLSIIRNGVRIVTLSDGFEYSRENSNLQNLMYSLLIMSRANEESATKSMRNRKAWEAKRTRARDDGTLVTSRLPSWLELTPEGEVIINQSRAAIIREIYQMTADGYGIVTIQKKLNSKYHGVRAKYISRAFIHKILRTRAVLGDFQPGRMVTENGKQVRKEDGEPIKSYFPAVIPLDLYYRAQASRASRKRTGGPRSKFVNLFQGKLYAADGSKMIIQGKKQRVYVSYAAVNAAPEAVPFHCLPVRCFEVATLFTLCEPSFQKAFANADEDHAPAEVEASLAEAADAERQIDAIKKQVLGGQMTTSVVELLGQLDNKKQSALKAAEEKRARFAVRMRSDPMTAYFKDIAEIMSGSMSEGERMRLKAIIDAYIQRIDCRVSREGKWFLVTADATLENNEKQQYRFACRTIKAEREWELFVAFHKGGWWHVRNDATQGVRAEVRGMGRELESRFALHW